MADGILRYDPNAEDAPVPAEHQSLVDAISNKLKAVAGTVIPSSVDPQRYYPDDEQAAQGRALTEHYQAQESATSGLFKNDVVPRPTTPPPEGIDYVMDATNFLFGDTAAALGVSWSRNGINADLDTARNMWSEHPYRAGLALAGDAGPAFASGLRVARALKGASADIDVGELLAKGLVESADHYKAMDGEAKYIVQSQAKKIADITEMRTAVDNGTATIWQKAKMNFYESFGNSYLDAQALAETNPREAIQQWRDKIGEITTGRGVSHLLDLADDIKPEEGTAILHSLRDPSVLSQLKDKSREFSLEFAGEARELQKQALAEGMIDQDTVDKVGDLWFSTLRKDSPLFEEGATTSTTSVLRRKAGEGGQPGDLRLINIPRTGSPNLKSRGLDQSEVTGLIKNQRAAEALEKGDKQKALRLIQGSPDEAQISSLLGSGQVDEAKALLGKQGFIESHPKDLVVKSLLQQKLLLENFRTLRDVATNPNLTKTADEVAAMSKATQKRMVSLDKVQNAGTLRRMVSIKTGKPVNELGFIDQSLFREVARMADHGTSNQFASLLEFSTAMLKTAKTSLNPFTHIQNSAGNSIFLWMAGMDLNKENFELGRQAWKSVWDYQKARKAGMAAEQINDLGKLTSKIKGAADIDIASEMANPILSGAHGLLDMGSFESSEGIPIMNRLYEQAGDHQVLLKKMIEWTQKASKKSAAGLSVEKMSNWYVAEDSAAKLTYYLHLRQRGLSPLGAANEVARRLPMYGTAGHTIQGLRKYAVPWLSFPSETIRIMKNNMYDNPLRTWAVMNVPDALQGSLAMAAGMRPDEVADRRAQAPMWAQKSSQVVVPSMFTDPVQNKANKGQMRSFMLDALPYFSVMPQSEAADASLSEKMPLGTGDLFPIISGFKDALEGKGQFGQDVPTDPNNPAQLAKTILLRTTGMLMPPVVQNYLMNPELPATYYKGGQDLGFYKNKSTGQTGSPFFDFALNNTLLKSYPMSPDTQVANSRFGDRRMADYRGRLGRELTAWTMSGKTENVIETLRSVKSTFDKEYAENPAQSERHYKDWLKLHSRDLMKNPAFKGISKTDFINKLSADAETHATKMNQAKQDYIDALRQGYQQTAGKKKSKGNPLLNGLYGD